MEPPAAAELPAGWLTVPEAAARAGVSERTIWNRIRDGSLEGGVDRRGPRAMIDPASLDRCFQRSGRVRVSADDLTYEQAIALQRLTNLAPGAPSLMGSIWLACERRKAQLEDQELAGLSGAAADLAGDASVAFECSNDELREVFLTAGALSLLLASLTGLSQPEAAVDAEGDDTDDTTDRPINALIRFFKSIEDSLRSHPVNDPRAGITVLSFDERGRAKRRDISLQRGEDAE